MTKTQESAYSRLMAAHVHCVEAAQLYATNLQGPDSKARLLKSCQKREADFQRALKAALR